MMLPRKRTVLLVLQVMFLVAFVAWSFLIRSL
jgi:hypothetical protein